MQCQDKTNYNAGFGVRFAAYMVDLLLVGIVTGIFRITIWSISLAYPDNIFNKEILFDKTGTAIIAYLISVIYFICSTYTSGRTIGKMIFKLKVVSLDEDGMNLWDICYRETIGRYLSTVIFHLGYLTIFINSNKQALHDLLADTKVVFEFSNSDISNIEVSNLEAATSDNRNDVSDYYQKPRTDDTNTGIKRRKRSIESYIQMREESLGHTESEKESEKTPEDNNDVVYGEDTNNEL
ncbi:MAG: RDD family protein [Lachnospiraceae bacterium]|nr:RDD family protein [Lachnospiraceae bacterium]